MGGAPGRAAAILLLLLVPACSKPVPPAPAPPPAPPKPPVLVLPDPSPEPWEKEKDAAKARTLKLETEWRLDPVFTDVKLRFIDARPILVGMEEDGSAEKQASMGALTGQSLRLLAGEIRKLLLEAGLKAPTLEEMGDERIRVMVFRNRETFDAWQYRNGFRARLNTYYNPRDRMILGWVGAEGSPDYLQLGTFALRHVYAHWLCNAEDAEEDSRRGVTHVPVEWEDHRLTTSFAWFEKGLVKYFGDFRVREDSLEPGRGMDDFGFSRFMGAKRWPLSEILFCDVAQIQSKSQVKDGGVGTGSELESLAYAQGHLLVRYLMEGDGGKWRPSFLALVKNEFSGISGKVYLLQAFGLVDEKGRALKEKDPKVQAWIAALEAGYLKYAEERAKPR